MTTQTQKAAQVEFKPDSLYLKGQKKRIVDFIEEHGSITPADAWEHCHCTKLATRIGEIERRCGHEFKHDMVETTTSRFMQYSFAEGLKASDYMTVKS